MSNRKSTSRKRARRRARPGERGGGRFYRIELRPNLKYLEYRYHDVGTRGGLERLAGKRPNGRWLTAAWLIEKNRAEILPNGQLRIKDPRDGSILRQIKGPVVHKKGDVFRAHPRIRS